MTGCIGVLPGDGPGMPTLTHRRRIVRMSASAVTYIRWHRRGGLQWVELSHLMPKNAKVGCWRLSGCGAGLVSKTFVSVTGTGESNNSD
jgi:hypothetical protein